MARAERERLREERKVEQELAAARERLEKERNHILTVIEKVRANGKATLNLSTSSLISTAQLLRTTTVPPTFGRATSMLSRTAVRSAITS